MCMREEGICKCAHMWRMSKTWWVCAGSRDWDRLPYGRILCGRRVCVEGISPRFYVGLINKPLYMDITYHHHWGSTRNMFTDGGESGFSGKLSLWQLHCWASALRLTPSDGQWYGRRWEGCSSTCCQWDGEDVPAPWQWSNSHTPVRVKNMCQSHMQ